MLLQSDSKFCLCYLDSESASAPSLWKPPRHIPRPEELDLRSLNLTDNADQLKETSTVSRKAAPSTPATTMRPRHNALLTQSLGDTPSWVHQSSKVAAKKERRNKISYGTQRRLVPSIRKKAPTSGAHVTASAPARQVWNCPGDPKEFMADSRTDEATDC